MFLDGIIICSNHDYYQVPLLQTFVFPQAEYWCPFCGYKGGMFDVGVTVDRTEELLKRKEAYKKHSQKYLSAVGTFTASLVVHKGKQIKPEDLPEDYKQEQRKIIDDYKLNQEIESIFSNPKSTAMEDQQKQAVEAPNAEAQADTTVTDLTQEQAETVNATGPVDAQAETASVSAEATAPADQNTDGRV